MKTWLQVQRGRFLQTRCDYILGMDRHQFKMAGIGDVRNYLWDHFALRARLLQHLMCCHVRYHRGCFAFHLFLSASEDFRPADRKFQKLKALEPTHPPLTCPPRPPMEVNDTNPADSRSGLPPLQPMTQPERGKYAHQSLMEVPHS